MKKYLICSAFLFIACICCSCSKKQVSPEKYLIDIMVKNEERLPLDYLVLSFVENGEESEITKSTQSNNDYVHFAMSYDPDLVFVLSGSVDGTEVERYYFDLKKFSNEEEVQEAYFYLHENDGGYFISEKAELP